MEHILSIWRCEMARRTAFNEMDIILKSDKLTYKVIGGIFDFYFFTPDACFSCAAISRSDWIFGHASLPDLGSAPVPLGYHSLDTFCDMIEGYKKAKIPLDGIWMDIE
ncbi:hypothetical protein BC937DRAFT_92698 [Endogone sp. FLAS-F59071]|nr:hypothetical protein BC937DRAFT_92698 [Endogone sp. FLAS-F59071]|eukprot:RUS15243.1 hypothetical protein BC937DRAFT_92698 [Endogone sp. FLAS-F59071]